MKKISISESVIIGFDHGLPCRVKNMALGPQLRQKPRPSASVFVYWVPRAMIFTWHGRPWSNPITMVCAVYIFIFLWEDWHVQAIIEISVATQRTILHISLCCILCRNCIHHKVQDEIIYLFPNLKWITWKWIIDFIPQLYVSDECMMYRPILTNETGCMSYYSQFNRSLKYAETR